MSWISNKQQQRDHSGQRDKCGACGHGATPAQPLALTNKGTRVHASHMTDRSSGLFGQQQK